MSVSETLPDQPPNARSDWRWHLGVVAFGVAWWVVYHQLIPFSEWITSLVPVDRHSHTGEAIAFSRPICSHARSAGGLARTPSRTVSGLG
ncbi:hypothetical protein [Paracoccus kondratievae]|uniref:hypothetical protein n=1 Tax=Paracoccus kondratievae TaxID=135740 RepID=UPI00187AEAF8|nr:hypothetical protein [Paracoccus kondratievae]